MSKTVFLHIGTAKTGTTALQRFLPQNAKVLHESGYDHPIMPFHFPRMGDGRNAHYLLMWDDTTKLSKRWDKGFEVLKETLECYDNIIMSDEVLWAECAREGFLERMCEGFADTGADLKIVVYLRRQDEMAESHWNQMVKGKMRLTLGFNEFVKSGQYEESFPLDYGLGLDRIADHIGKDNIIVRVYEKQQFEQGSLFADFLKSVGLSLTDKYELPEFVVNTRLPENVVEIKRWINMADSYRSQTVPNYYREIIKQTYSLEQKSEVPVQEEGRFSDEERRNFMEAFKDSNSYVAREYLDRADGVLFYDEFSDLPQWEADYKELLKDAVRVLAGADVYEYVKRRELENEIKQLRDETMQLGSELEAALLRIDELESKVRDDTDRKSSKGVFRRLHKK